MESFNQYAVIVDKQKAHNDSYEKKRAALQQELSETEHQIEKWAKQICNDQEIEGPVLIQTSKYLVAYSGCWARNPIIIPIGKIIDLTQNQSEDGNKS